METSSSFVVRLFGNIQRDVGCWFMREILYLVKEVSLYSWLTKLLSGRGIMSYQMLLRCLLRPYNPGINPARLRCVILLVYRSIFFPRGAPS